MKLTNFLRLGFTSVVLIASYGLQAQQEFLEAHEKVTEFWKMADKPTKDPAKRATIVELASKLPGEVNGLISGGILKYLDTNQAISMDDLSVKIARALASPFVAAEASTEGIVSIVPLPATEGYAVAFNVSTCASCSASWIGVFRRDRKRSELVAYIESPSLNNAVHLAWFGPKASPFLVLYGVHWGDAHSRLNVQAYAVEGRHLRPVWSLLDQPDGAIAIQGNRMTITSYTALVSPFFQKRQTFGVIGGRVKLLHTFVSKTPE